MLPRQFTADTKSGLSTAEQRGIYKGAGRARAGLLAKVLAKCNRTTGVYEGRIAVDADAGVIASEEHGLDVKFTGTLASGKGIVAGNFACSPVGTAGTWAAGIYAKVVQDATKRVNGYTCAGEFEIVNGAIAANLSDFGVIVLNFNNSATSSISNVSHGAYVMLREYSATQKCKNLLSFYDVVPGASAAGTIIDAAGADRDMTHGVRCQFGTTTFWLMATTTAP